LTPFAGVEHPTWVDVRPCGPRRQHAKPRIATRSSPPAAEKAAPRNPTKLIGVRSRSTAGILVEAEAFDEFGGWVLDSQFDSQMGSPYLLAHGLGKPVADATTVIAVPDAGRYHVWVRATDWVPQHHPGRFTLTINGTTLDTEFAANG
jgi:hypothetical protein